jgi:hypothetical protein
MTLSKTSVQSIDLDDLERQLREVAVSSAPKKNEDPLSELARIVGREKPLRSIVGGRAEAPQSVAQPVVANDASPAQPRFAEGRAMARPTPPALQPAIDEEAWADQAEDTSVEEVAYAEDEDAAPSYEEEWEGEPAVEDESVYAAENGAPRFDAVEQVPGMSAEPAAAPRRGFMSPRMLAITVPVLLALVGVGAAVALRGTPILSKRAGDAPVIKADESPVKVQPAKAADSDQTPSQAALDAADPLSKPSQVVLARPEQPVDVVAAVKGAQPPGPAPAQPPASSGIVVISGPAASPGSTGGAAPSAALPMPTAAANVPLPDPPQPSAQGSVFGTPRRVSTVAVKPDGTIVSNGKPKVEAAPTPAPRRIASADPVAPSAPEPAPAPASPAAAAPDAAASPAPATPAPKKPADAVRAKPTPAVAADGQADAKPPRPVAKPAKAKVADIAPVSHAIDARSDNGGPLSITPQGRHGRASLASAAPEESPRAAAAAAPTNISRGESGYSVQLASSPSESDARATLSRLQRQFPSALGGGSIRRADLGGKGIYYRVRVGPLTRDAADKICTQLKAGGADCILTRG